MQRVNGVASFDAVLQGTAVASRRASVTLRPVEWVRSQLFDVIGLIWLAAATAVIGLYRSGSATSLWTDELFSVTFASKPWHVIAQQLWGENANMALYYVLLASWLHGLAAIGIGHPDEWLIRIPSIVFAVAAVIAAYFTASRLIGRLAGLVAATLLMLNYVFLMEVAQARAYSLALFLQLVGWYLFVRILDSGKRDRRLAVGLGLVMAASIYADLFSALVIFAQFVAFVAVARIDPRIRAHLPELARVAAVTGSTIVLAVIPIGLDVVLHRAPNDWIPTPGLHELVTFAGALSSANPLLALFVAAGMALGFVSYARRPARPGHATALQPRTVVLLLAIWIAVPLVMSYVLSHHPFEQHLFLTRYLLPIVPPICILVSAGLFSLGDPRLRAAAVAGVVLVATAALPLYYSRVQREDFSVASSWLSQRYHAGDGVACASLGCAFALEYYAPGKMQADSPGNYVWNPGQFGHVAVDSDTLGAYSELHDRLFFVYGTAGQSPFIADDEAWLLEHGYRITDRLVTTPGSAGPVTVELFERLEAGTSFSAGW